MEKVTKTRFWYPLIEMSHTYKAINIFFFVITLDLHSCDARVGPDVIPNTISWFTIHENVNAVVYVELIVGEKHKQQKNI